MYKNCSRNYTKSGIGDYILRDRIIKRSLNPTWEGDVYEAIPIDKSWECMYATDITITHKKEYVNDKNRNINIFKKNIKEDKTLSPFEKVNYCKELVLFHQCDKAYDVYREIKNANSTELLYYPLSFLVKGLIEDKRYEDCIKEIEYLEKKMPITAYMIYMQGICYENIKRIDVAKECYQKAMTIPEDPTTLEIQYNGYNDYFPMLRLALFSFKDGDIKEAYEYANKAAKLYPKHDEWKRIKLQLLLMTKTV